MVMKEVVTELDKIVSEFIPRIEQLSDVDFEYKEKPNKWSKKEVVGHLIDSGQTNLRRFICGQYDSSPSKIVYDQDFWVNANQYQKMERKHVVTLWQLINRQIATVLRTMAKENYDKLCDTSKGEPHLRTLEWLAVDYVKHLKHHLNQVMPGSFNITYP